ncbi:hypothetical protein BVRB_9g214500 [Beta vulgaris subsp. vulgaris]|nr:hypothetical protein BVRB_9g214500 [Beta vulgaris subsp. vulgaris]
MNKLLNFLLVVFVFVATDIHGVQGNAMVTGTVFCDQCKDGQVSIFDYPLSGMKVTMVCPGTDGQMTVVGEDTTNMLGNYGITFDGTPDLSSCFTQISPNNTIGPDSNKCGVAPGPAKSVKLMFSMFDMEMFTVDPLISQPAQPMSYCSTSSAPPSPVSLPPPTSSSPPSPVTLPPPTSSSPPSPVTLPPPTSSGTPPKGPTPTFKLPPMPRIPPLTPMPPAPFLQDSACSHEYWTMPQYKCYWRAVNPQMPVGLVFGPLAAQKYGTDLTLRKGLEGKGDPYKTLLREGVTALLNSYNSFHFPYNALEVLHSFNTALTGSNRNVLLTALRYKRANTGYGHVPCKFQSCK